LLLPLPSITGSWGSDDFDEAHFDGLGIVKATDLQIGLAHLAVNQHRMRTLEPTAVTHMPLLANS
jgi:hypothetical protein